MVSDSGTVGGESGPDVVSKVDQRVEKRTGAGG